MVRNEEDIIESFCRYTLHFCDGLLILNDSSIDHTGVIIKQLIEEGLRIELFETPPDGINDFGKYQFNVYNDLARQAFNERGADWVIPLDADEFLFCPDYSDPKAAIENLDESFEYRIRCRTYIIEEPPSDNSVFLPYRFQSYLRDPKEGQMVKTILSRKLCFESHAKISTGHHHLEYDAEPYPKINFTDGLLLAHYPFRSVEQMLSKVIIGELNHKASLNRNDFGLHFNMMYDAIKKFQSADAGLVRRFCLFYSGIYETDVDSPEPFETEPLRTDYLKEPISLKVTNPQPGQYAYLAKILAGMESIITKFRKTAADHEQTKKDLSECLQKIADIKKPDPGKLKDSSEGFFSGFTAKK